MEIITKIYSWIKSRQQLIVWFLSSIDIFKIQPLHQNSGKLRKDVKIITDDQSIQFKLVSFDKKRTESGRDRKWILVELGEEYKVNMIKRRIKFLNN